MTFSQEQLNKAYEAVGNAISDAVLQHVVDRISARSYNFDKATTFFRSCYNESERAAPVLIFSFIENAIKELFSLELEVTKPAELNSIFGQLGPLATTSSRVRMLAALGWISSETSKDLHVLRKIRNQFAHDPPLEGFLNPRVQDLLRKLHADEERLLDVNYLRSIGVEITEAPRTDGKTIFIARSGFVFSRMFLEISTFPSCRRAGLPATAILSRDRKALPDILKNAMVLGGRIAFEAIYDVGSE